MRLSKNLGWVALILCLFTTSCNDDLPPKENEMQRHPVTLLSLEEIDALPANEPYSDETIPDRGMVIEWHKVGADGMALWFFSRFGYSPENRSPFYQSEKHGDVVFHNGDGDTIHFLRFNRTLRGRKDIIDLQQLEGSYTYVKPLSIYNLVKRTEWEKLFSDSNALLIEEWKKLGLIHRKYENISYREQRIEAKVDSIARSFQSRIDSLNHIIATSNDMKATIDASTELEALESEKNNALHRVQFQDFRPEIPDSISQRMERIIAKLQERIVVKLYPVP